MSIRLLFAVATFASFATNSQAGDLTFSPSGWSNIVTTGSASGLSTLTDSDPLHIAGSLGIKALSSGTYTVKANWSFTAKWTPTTTGETAPTSAKITIWRNATPTVAGTGALSLTDANSNVLVSVDSTSLWQSGMTLATNDIVVTVPLTAQSDGTYTGSGVIISDTISVTYDATGSTQTNGEESFALGNMEAVSP